MRGVVLFLLTVTACGRWGFDATAIATTDGATDGVDAVNLTIVITGTGSGQVSSGTQTCSSGTCTFAVPRDAAFELAATASASSWFRGWTSGCGGGRHGCSIVASSSLTVTADFTPQPNRIFTSSTTHDGLIGSVGDSLCQGLADGIGLGGTYRIVLSAGGVSWQTHLGAARGWIRTDDEPVADTISDLDTGVLQSTLDVDEHGTPGVSASNWSVSATANFCTNWTTNGAAFTGGAIPDSSAGFLGSAASIAYHCNLPQHFLCAEVDRSVPVQPVPAQGRAAFVSLGWDVASGRAAADAACAADATAAQLPGTFSALLAVAGETPLARFDLSGAPWIRRDGIPLLPAGTDFATAPHLAVVAGMTADRTSQSLGVIPLGAFPITATAVISDTCSDWSSAAGNVLVLAGTWDTGFYGQTGCGGPMAVLCLQQ